MSVQTPHAADHVRAFPCGLGLSPTSAGPLPAPPQDPVGPTARAHGGLTSLRPAGKVRLPVSTQPSVKRPLCVLRGVGV